MILKLTTVGFLGEAPSPSIEGGREVSDDRIQGRELQIHQRKADLQ